MADILILIKLNIIIIRSCHLQAIPMDLGALVTSPVATAIAGVMMMSDD